MTAQRIAGIVIRVYPLTESSLIVQWITPEMGRISTVANGARRSKSPFLGKLDILFTADLVIQPSRRSKLHKLREVKVGKTREPLRHSIPALQRVGYAIRLLERTTESDTPLPGLYSLFESFLDAVTYDPNNPLLVLAFELRVLSQSGLVPDLNAVALMAPTRQLAIDLLEGQWASLGQIRPTPGQEHELGQLNARFMLSHLERLPEGRRLALNHSQDL